MVKFAKFLIDVPAFLSSSTHRLANSTKNQKQPLANKMNMLTCLIPGKNVFTKTSINLS